MYTPDNKKSRAFERPKELEILEQSEEPEEPEELEELKEPDEPEHRYEQEQFDSLYELCEWLGEEAFETLVKESTMAACDEAIKLAALMPKLPDEKDTDSMREYDALSYLCCLRGTAVFMDELGYIESKEFDEFDLVSRGYLEATLGEDRVQRVLGPRTIGTIGTIGKGENVMDTTAAIDATGAPMSESATTGVRPRPNQPNQPNQPRNKRSLGFLSSLGKSKLDGLKAAGSVLTEILTKKFPDILSLFAAALPGQEAVVGVCAIYNLVIKQFTSGIPGMNVAMNGICSTFGAAGVVGVAETKFGRIPFKRTMLVILASETIGLEMAGMIEQIATQVSEMFGSAATPLKYIGLITQASKLIYDVYVSYFYVFKPQNDIKWIESLVGTSGNNAKKSEIDKRRTLLLRLKEFAMRFKQNTGRIRSGSNAYNTIESLEFILQHFDQGLNSSFRRRLGALSRIDNNTKPNYSKEEVEEVAKMINELKEAIESTDFIMQNMVDEFFQIFVAAGGYIGRTEQSIDEETIEETLDLVDKFFNNARKIEQSGHDRLATNAENLRRSFLRAAFKKDGEWVKVQTLWEEMQELYEELKRTNSGGAGANRDRPPSGERKRPGSDDNGEGSFPRGDYARGRQRTRSTLVDDLIDDFLSRARF